MKLQKLLSAVLAVAMVSTFALTGCSSTPKNDTTSKDTASTASKEESKEEVKAPDEITVFMGTAGLKFPEGAKPDDNPYVNKIAELANVKFKEVIVPEYTDFQTKFNLMLSSGKIPDLVHCWFPADVQMQGAQGAFLDLNDVIANSAVLSADYTPTMINLLKDDKGGIYALKSLAALDTMAAAVNPFLIKELNNGVVPITPEDWYTLFKKEKETYPDSVPFTAIGGLDGLELFFKAYGAAIMGNGVEWQYKDGKIINGLQAPMAKDAVVYYNKLYKEGILDKTFVTNKGDDYRDRRENKKAILWSNNLNSCVGSIVVPGPLPRCTDPRVTDDDAYYAMPLLGNHCVSIGAQTKQKDAVVRLIETLVSPEVKELSSWGIKGVDFNEVDGKKVMTPEADVNIPTRGMYRLMWSYGNDESVSIMTNAAKTRQPEDVRDYYSQMLDAGMEVSYKQGRAAAQSPVSYITLDPDVQSKVAECQEVSKTIIVKAILGEISMDEFDKQVAAFNTKYQFIADNYNAKAPAVLEKLK